MGKQRAPGQARPYRHSSHPHESRNEGEEGEAVEGCSVVSGGEAAAEVERVAGAGEAGAGGGECGVIAEEARALGRAGVVGLDVGETGAEGIGGRKRRRPAPGGAAPPPFRAGPVARRRPVRASGAHGPDDRGEHRREAFWSSGPLGSALKHIIPARGILNVD